MRKFIIAAWMLLALCNISFAESAPEASKTVAAKGQTEKIDIEKA